MKYVYCWIWVKIGTFLVEVISCFKFYFIIILIIISAETQFASIIDVTIWLERRLKMKMKMDMKIKIAVLFTMVSEICKLRSLHLDKSRFRIVFEWDLAPRMDLGLGAEVYKFSILCWKTSLNFSDFHTYPAGPSKRP